MSGANMEDMAERLRKVEQDTAVNGQKLDHLTEDYRRLETQKIDPMFQQVREMHSAMMRNKGFVAGAFMMAGAVWAVIGAFGVAIWNRLFGHS